MITNVEIKHVQAFEENDSIFGDGVIGSFVRNTSKLKLINISKQYNELIGAEIKVAGFGTKYVEEIKPTQENSSIEMNCVDLSYRFDYKYELETIFPITLLDWVKQICEKVGVELRE